MKRLKLLLPALAIAGVGLFLGRHARAADHIDGPQATGEPAADIADLYAWMNSDASKVNLVMTVNTSVNPSATALFSDAVEYVFHTESQAGFGASPVQSQDIICTFTGTAAPQQISCWAGNEYVTGDASNTAGISSADGKLKVFAGSRNDPFFFNLDGFHAAVSSVEAAAGGLTFDAAGCPTVSAPISTFLVNQLSTNPADAGADGAGGPAVDPFASANVLAIVLQVDKSVLNAGGDVMSVWASTNQLPTP